MWIWIWWWWWWWWIVVISQKTLRHIQIQVLKFTMITLLWRVFIDENCWFLSQVPQGDAASGGKPPLLLVAQVVLEHLHQLEVKFMVSSPAMTAQNAFESWPTRSTPFKPFWENKDLLCWKAGEAALLGDTPMRDDPAVDVVIKVGNDRVSGGKSTKICLKQCPYKEVWSFSSRVVLRHYTGVLLEGSVTVRHPENRDGESGHVQEMSVSTFSQGTKISDDCPFPLRWRANVEACYIYKLYSFKGKSIHQIHLTSTPTTPNFWAPGHVGSSSCPAGPLEEALRGFVILSHPELGYNWGTWTQSGGFNPQKSARSPLVFASHRHFETLFWLWHVLTSPSGSKSFCPTVMSSHCDTTRQRHRFGKRIAVGWCCTMIPMPPRSMYPLSLWLFWWDND